MYPGKGRPCIIHYSTTPFKSLVTKNLGYCHLPHLSRWGFRLKQEIPGLQPDNKTFPTFVRQSNQALK